MRDALERWVGITRSAIHHRAQRQKIHADAGTEPNENQQHAGEEFVALYLWLHSNYSFGAQAEHARKTMGGCGFGVLPQATRRDAANGANAGGERNQLT